MILTLRSPIVDIFRGNVEFFTMYTLRKLYTGVVMVGGGEDGEEAGGFGFGLGPF